MTNNKIIPIEECPMCGDENVQLIDICPINNPDHKICAECIVNLIEKYNTKCCVYCGERPVIINIPVTINPHHESVNITIQHNSNQNSNFSCVIELSKTVTMLILIALCYVILILNWHVFLIINCFLADGYMLDEKVNWHIYNAFYALFTDSFLLFLYISVTDKNKY